MHFGHMDSMCHFDPQSGLTVAVALSVGLVNAGLSEAKEATKSYFNVVCGLEKREYRTLCPFYFATFVSCKIFSGECCLVCENIR